MNGATERSIQRILVVDDEPVVTDVVQRYLKLEGFDVAIASDGLKALEVADSWKPDLVVLDLMLPKLDGLSVCRELRSNTATPIIMLTARGEESDRIVGLELGADDYVVKPFSPRELVARVKSVLRRVTDRSLPEVSKEEALMFGCLVISQATRQVTQGGRQVNLTTKEFDLLHFLAIHPGHVFTRDQLMEHVWDFAYAGDSSTVTVHVRRLREKLEPDPEKPRYVKTVWGVGYKFEAVET